MLAVERALAVPSFVGLPLCVLAALTVGWHHVVAPRLVQRRHDAAYFDRARRRVVRYHGTNGGRW